MLPNHDKSIYNVQEQTCKYDHYIQRNGSTQTLVLNFKKEDINTTIQEAEQLADYLHDHPKINYVEFKNAVFLVPKFFKALAPEQHKHQSKPTLLFKNCNFVDPNKTFALLYKNGFTKWYLLPQLKTDFLKRNEIEENNTTLVFDGKIEDGSRSTSNDLDIENIMIYLSTYPELKTIHWKNVTFLSSFFTRLANVIQDIKQDELNLRFEACDLSGEDVFHTITNILTTWESVHKKKGHHQFQDSILIQEKIRSTIMASGKIFKETIRKDKENINFNLAIESIRQVESDSLAIGIYNCGILFTYYSPLSSTSSIIEPIASIGKDAYYEERTREMRKTIRRNINNLDLALGKYNSEKENGQTDDAIRRTKSDTPHKFTTRKQNTQDSKTVHAQTRARLIEEQKRKQVTNISITQSTNSDKPRKKQENIKQTTDTEVDDFIANFKKKSKSNPGPSLDTKKKKRKKNSEIKNSPTEYSPQLFNDSNKKRSDKRLSVVITSMKKTEVLQRVVSEKASTTPNLNN